MSQPEVFALFQRGRAEVNGKGATTPPAFAAAILHCGVDAGIREFRRFLLLRTTSENTFESRLASVVPVAGKAEGATAVALTRMLNFRDSLPPDRKKGKRWIYAGLRGSLDEALVAFAEKQTPETACAAVDTMIASLRMADRNRAHRRSKSASPPRPPIRFQQLPGAWAASLLDENGGDACAEARIGLALATLCKIERTGKSGKVIPHPLLPNWLGVEMRGPFCTMPEAVPFRRVWGAGILTANLAAVLHRRLIEEEPFSEPPFDAWHCVALGDIEAWLAGSVDDAEAERWAMRFSLFDWKRENVAGVVSRLGHSSSPASSSADLALFALLKPLFQPTLLSALLSTDGQPKAPKVGPLPGIAGQLARGDLTAAVRLARNAYRAAGIAPAKLPSKQFACADPQRLLAALLIPARSGRLTEISLRWLSPRKNNNHNL